MRAPSASDIAAGEVLLVDSIGELAGLYAGAAFRAVERHVPGHAG